MNISPYLKQLGYVKLKEKQKEILRSITSKKDTKMQEVGVGSKDLSPWTEVGVGSK